MAYQVLARKWRPQSFSEMLGQSTVLETLINALENNWLHHAYLFTGSRGVGKTSIARILAKCLNCEQGVSAHPCGVCSSCREITAGCFVDLIEVDAASRTKVDDTRDLIENVKYAPTRGRYKIYLIDEVHMLSNHSFNALLKTLEEPPPHVKFLLATTDPQKLPVTVLSRCLQFHLKNLSTDQLSKHLTDVLDKESMKYEPQALSLLAEAASGSVRDALSLLDQAVAQGNGIVSEPTVTAMLGTIDKDYIRRLLQALSEKNTEEVLTIIKQMAEFGVDFDQAYVGLLTELHQLALAKMLRVSNTAITDTEHQLFSPEIIQLYYQIGLLGRRDMHWSPSARVSFEMTLMRMLAFQPMTALSNDSTMNLQLSKQDKSQLSTEQSSSSKESSLVHRQWTDLIAQLKISGMVLALANNCIPTVFTDEEIVLSLDPKHVALLNQRTQDQLIIALKNLFGVTFQVNLIVDTVSDTTPAKQKEIVEHQQNDKSRAEIINDPQIQNLINTFEAKILSDSVEPQVD